MRRLIVLLLSLLLLTSLGTATVMAQQVHIVQRGDTLSNISSRYGVNLADLLQANGMTMSSIIHRGNQIVIPGTGGTGGSSAPAAPAAPAGNTTYTVQRGDFLALIAANHRTTYTHLAELNGLVEPYILHVGQVLVVPAVGGAAAPGVGAPTSPSVYASYTVQTGDSLAAIAAKYGMTYFELAQLNNIENPDAIDVGQVLTVPGPPEPPPPAPAPAPAPVGSAPAPPPSPSVSGGFELGGQALSFSQPQAMHHARMTWVKRQVRWNGSQGAGDFQSWIDHAHGLGFKILLSVLGDHHQLASNPGQYYQNFANFLAGLARGGADAIEVWNEPNIDREWPAGQISGANYTQMLTAAYHAIKSSSPGTMVISAAPTPTGYFGGCSPNGADDDCYIRDMAAAGAANVMDCVGVHWNNGFLPPTATTGGPSGHYSYYLPSITNLYRSVFPGKPLCYTELGYVSPEGYPPLPQGFAWGAGTSVAEQAAWLAGSVNYLRGQNTRLLIIWNVDSTTYVGGDPQGGYAIVRPNGGCPACDSLRAAMGG